MPLVPLHSINVSTWLPSSYLTCTSPTSPHVDVLIAPEAGTLAPPVRSATALSTDFPKLRFRLFLSLTVSLISSASASTTSALEAVPRAVRGTTLDDSDLTFFFFPCPLDTTSAAYQFPSLSYGISTP